MCVKIHNTRGQSLSAVVIALPVTESANFLSSPGEVFLSRQGLP